MSGERGRPVKPEGEAFTHFLYVRMRKDQYEALQRIAKAQGFSTNGGMSAAARWAIDKMDALIGRKSK